MKVPARAYYCLQGKGIRMQILTIWKWFEPFESDLNHSNANWNPSSEIRSVRMQILTIPNGFEAFESKFEPLEKAFERKLEAS